MVQISLDDCQTFDKTTCCRLRCADLCSVNNGGCSSDAICKVLQLCHTVITINLTFSACDLGLTNCRFTVNDMSAILSLYRPPSGLYTNGGSSHTYIKLY